ncbi:hypothetical protein AHAS_Ahas13G0295100 [Arachis hypogaea]
MPQISSFINVVMFGAKDGNRFDSTKAFLKAWSSACKSSAPARIYVPKGSFLLKQISFSGPCRNNKIEFQIEGTPVAPSNYWSIRNSGYWILFRKVNWVSVYGGTLDGKAAAYWHCRRAGKTCPAGAGVCIPMLCISS